jgi:PD-(D/E)XK nuclease superfamily protein
MSLGYTVAKPYGQMHRYDFILEADGGKLLRIQVKTTITLRDGAYQLCVQRITHHRVVAYTPSDFDFVAAYIIPEDTWFIIPISVIAGRRSLLLPSKLHPRRKSWLTPYQEAWHQTGHPPSADF